MNYDATTAIISLGLESALSMNQPTLNYVSCPGAAAMAPSWASAQRRQQTEAQPEGTHRMAYWEWNNTGNPQHPHVIVCVHGLSRQGRDFDVLAAQLSRLPVWSVPMWSGAARATGWQTPWAIKCLCTRPICWRCWLSCTRRPLLKHWTGSAPAWEV